MLGDLRKCVDMSHPDVFAATLKRFNRVQIWRMWFKAIPARMKNPYASNLEGWISLKPPNAHVKPLRHFQTQFPVTSKKI